MNWLDRLTHERAIHCRQDGSNQHPAVCQRGWRGDVCTACPEHQARYRGAGAMGFLKERLASLADNRRH